MPTGLCNQRAVGRLLWLLSLILAAGCGQSLSDPTSNKREPRERPLVYATNYPLMYFAQRIAGEHADVQFPAPADVDPAYWKPAPEIVRLYQNADLILLNGANYAKWIEQHSLPTNRLVDTSRAFADRFITIDEGIVHSHGPQGEHSHQGIAFTTWLDPHLAELHAMAIRDALVRQMPQHADSLNVKFAVLQADLRDLDARLDTAHREYAGAPLLASHPVYQYLARRCSWNLHSVHWEPDEMPPEVEWTALATRLKDYPAKWMIWEAPPAEEIAARLQQLGVESVVFEPCGNVPSTGDYLSVMRQNIDNILPALSGKATSSEAPLP
jgi:zinc transport system substrate-binding protein